MKFIVNKSIIANIFRIQAYDSVLCAYFCIGFIDFMFTKRTAADKVLRGKAFNIPKDPKCDGYQRGLASMVCKFFDKKSKGSGVTALTNKSVSKSAII